MKYFLAAFSLLLASCSTTMWTTKTTMDEFTDETRCKISVGSDFGKSLAKSLGGIHYYPFIARSGKEVIFGIENDYNLPLGDAQVRVDRNPMVEVTAADTPIFLAPKQPKVDMSYLENMPGIDAQAMQKSMNKMTKQIQASASPFRAVGGEKARTIIRQLTKGEKLKIRIVAVNKVASTTGEWELDGSLPAALKECGIDPATIKVVSE